MVEIALNGWSTRIIVQAPRREGNRKECAYGHGATIMDSTISRHRSKRSGEEEAWDGEIALEIS